jgi:hypothetical protein
MGRTFFGFGRFKTSHDGREKGAHTGPPPDENPNYAEFLASRPETSHSTLGLIGVPNLSFTTPGGEVRRGAKVTREERNPQTGAIDAYVESQGSGKKETHRIRFEPHRTRSMIQTENVRVDSNEAGS